MVIGGMQIKTTRYHYTPMKMTHIKRLMIPSVRKHAEQMGLIHSDKKVKWHSQYGDCFLKGNT